MEINKSNKNLDEAAEQDTLTFEELFPSNFIREHTKEKYNTYQEFFQNSGFNINSQEDLDVISEDELNKLDEYIRGVTDFNSWKQMLNDAASIYYEEQLGYGCIKEKVKMYIRE